MDTKQIVQQDEQDLKAERVQGETALIAEEPFRVWLKAERVQAPSLAVLGAEVPVSSSAFELTLNQKQQVTIDLPGHQTVITLHGRVAGDATADAAQAPGLGEAG